MENVKIAGATIAGFIVVAVLVLFFNSLDFSMFSFFAPKYEAVRRQTFEQSQAYNEGMVRDLENIRNQYLQTNDPASKAALAETFKHRAEGYPNQLPADLQSFYSSIR